jgi:hypothetical protein
LNDVSEVLAALKVEAANTSEMMANFTRLHGATTHKTTIFIFTPVSTSNPASIVLFRNPPLVHLKQKPQTRIKFLTIC